jgi:hypothetical protein
MLLSGLDERRWALTHAGQRALGIETLPTNVQMAELYREFEEGELAEMGMIAAAQPILDEVAREQEIHEAFDETYRRIEDVSHGRERVEMVLAVANAIDAMPTVA